MLAVLGASELRTQENPAAVGEVAAAISPWRLPAEVEQFWRLTDGYSSSLSLFPHPHAADPQFALECWHEHQQQPGMTPDLLFPVCYESHAFLLVELDGPPGTGGACFTWAYGLEPFVLVASDLTSYLEVAAQTLEVGRVERHERDGQTFLRFDDTAFQAALRDRLVRDPHPRYGDRMEVDWHPSAWPEHWLASAGPAAAEQHARGATTTIAALRRNLVAGVSGRVHAQVLELWGLSEGVRVSVDDGTGVLHIWCPSAVTMFGPASPGRFEFDVVITPDAPHATHAEAVAVRLLDPEA
ncbi:hypothetical protein [Nocardioides gansuensis]|uniref:hypothetical protein n=1 Tax=Nocardioides gansuensis TaxID=2138300 RepID=UPI0010582C20|nr:hypothetical protein [Nocardioides gansuensis]